MKPTVHILARVRKQALLPAALLVFRSLRTGFPSAPVQVWGNHLSHEFERVVAKSAAAAGANFANISRTSHDAWIESLILESTHPFWIVDTDVVFWGSMEEKFQGEFAGRFEPEFVEGYTLCQHVERLHTCVMYIDPARTRAAMREFMSKVPEDLRESAQFPMVREHFIPRRGSITLFYDTMAGLYQAGYGEAFTEEENDCFDHLHCGSYVDLISDSLESRPSIQEQHQAVYQNPELLRGARHKQNEYYKTMAPEEPFAKGKEAVCPTHQE